MLIFLLPPAPSLCLFPWLFPPSVPDFFRVDFPLRFLLDLSLWCFFLCSAEVVATVAAWVVVAAKVLLLVLLDFVVRAAAVVVVAFVSLRFLLITFFSSSMEPSSFSSSCFALCTRPILDVASPPCFSTLRLLG